MRTNKTLFFPLLIRQKGEKKLIHKIEQETTDPEEQHVNLIRGINLGSKIEQRAEQMAARSRETREKKGHRSEASKKKKHKSRARIKRTQDKLSTRDRASKIWRGEG